MDLGLKNKNVLITGSTKGLGKAIAEVLASEGANIIVSGRKEQEAEVARKELKPYNTKVEVILADLLKKGEAEALFDKSIEALGSLDILINNAAIWLQDTIFNMPKDHLEDTLYLNLEVPILLSQKMVNYLIKNNKPGKIIQVVSQAAFGGSKTGHSHYAAAKAGLVNFNYSLAREVAGKGINVVAIAPGMIQTEMTADQIEERKDYYKSTIPIGRIAEPIEIAYLVGFLASDKANYLTGMTLDASGGMIMR